jgi:hypothetical protein
MVPEKTSRGMTAMGWGAVWQAAWTAFGAEAVEVRLLIIVLAAFSVLMILIGLRHAFRPAGPRRDEPVPEMPRRVFAAMPPQLVAPAAAQPAPQPVPQPLRVPMPVLRVKRKSAKRINRHRTLRPQIHRADNPEFDAPYSPLPPRL